MVTGPMTAMAAPPTGGPTIVADQFVDSKRPLATTSRSAGTTVPRYVPLAAPNAIFATAATIDTTNSCAKENTPSQ
ncbi:hypothetical protein GCM10023318_19600 [Nocardia callitridis]|uniref:Uncharacterized protein n=1 Tax=Nocardia callitridis TaxID=648753 RepID=A0ABP9K380_9NOCA